jgi:hypothetical protein
MTSVVRAGWLWSLCSLCSLPALSGCPEREISEVYPTQDSVEVKDIPGVINRAIDIVFLVDKSPTMEDEQAALAANFPRFIEVLETIEGGLPELHLGVITQDVGAGPYTDDRCVGDGDGGELQGIARVPGCTPPTGNYISDVSDLDGDRIKNYTGNLADTFSCIAQVGPAGCGFEQHLASLELALGGTVAANNGFLRSGAFLAVVVISDEDDCSASDPANLFNPGAGNTGPLGPLWDYRCAEYGWTCDGGPIGREPGSYESCVPREDSPYIHHPDHYVEFLKELKQDDDLVIVASIIGKSSPIVIGTNEDNGFTDVQPSCRNGAQNAEPMPRLSYFGQQFPGRNIESSICDDDLADELREIGEMIARTLGTPCFQTELIQTDLSTDPGLQLDCAVTEILHPDTEAAIGTPLPRCRMIDDATVDPASAQPCYYVYRDEVQCETYPTQLALGIYPPDRVPPPDSAIHAECVTD